MDKDFKESMKFTAGFTLLVFVLAIGWALVKNRHHYRLVDDGKKFGYVYFIYQHRDGHKVGCYFPVDSPKDPWKCTNLDTQESVPNPVDEHDVE